MVDPSRLPRPAHTDPRDDPPHSADGPPRTGAAGTGAGGAEPAPEAGGPTDRAFHLARVCAGFTPTISRRSAERLARLLSPPDDDGQQDSHAA